MPDAETTRLEALENFRIRSQYVAGHAYITALPRELQQEKRTAIKIAQLYLSQGHYIRAWDACNLPEAEIFENGETTEAFTQEICDQDSATLALVRAFVGISRYGRSNTALRVADRIHSVWLAGYLKESIANNEHGVPADAQEELLAAATAQWSALQQFDDGSGAKDVKVTESRILMEYWYLKIRIVAAEQGLLEQSPTKRGAADRLDALSQWTIVRGRFREARYLIHLRIDLVENNVEDLKVLRGYMSAVADTKYVVEQAQTHLDLAKCKLRTKDPQLSKEAAQHVAKANEIFKVEGHMSGELDLMDMQIDENANITLKARLDWKLGCAENYLKQECHQQGIRCLLFAIPVNNDMGEIFRHTQSMIERVQQEISKIGGALLEQVLFVNTIAQSLVRATEYGYARQALEEYMTRLPDEISNKHLSTMHSCLRGAYTNVGDFEKSLFHAEQSLVTSLQSASYVDISDAALALAISKIDRCRQLAQCSDIARLWLADVVRFLTGWVAIDGFMFYYKQAAEKCAWSANVEMQIGIMFNDERALSRSDEYLDAAVEMCTSHNIFSPQTREMTILRAARQQESDLAVKVASDRIRVLQAEVTTSPFDLAQATMSGSINVYSRFQSRGSAAELKTDEQRVLIIQDLFEATKLANDAFKLYKAIGGSEMIVKSLNWLWYLIRHLPTDTIGDMLRELLVEAETIEIFCDAVRRSSASTQDASSLFEKRRLISGKKYRDLYSNAIETYVELGDLPAAWRWTQKSKARALSDVFGVRAIVPPALLECIASDEYARALYERERLNTERALEAGPQEYLSARRKGESDRAEMRRHSLLSQVLDIREGAFNVDSDSSELTEAMKLTGMSSECIKYVDWFVCSSKKNEDKIILLVRQLDGTTSSQTLDMDASTIENWKRRVFGHPEEAEHPLRGKGARSKLYELAPLVKGLEKMTKKEDLLILSPSGVLNGIPLHALPVGKGTLIERNPIIYSSSAAVFRQCHMRATAQASKYSGAVGSVGSSPTEKAAFLTVYDAFDLQTHLEQSAIYAHADTISSTSGLPVSVYKGAAATKVAFTHALQQSPWLHFHGHALFDERDVLQSCLVLSDGKDRSITFAVDAGCENTPIPPPATQANDALSLDDPESSNLTVSNILSLSSLPTAPHITVIACDSGTQTLAPGDEPLGLVSALLYAGAASVLGALWPVDSHTARIFSETFYQELRQQIDAQLQAHVEAQKKEQTDSQTQSSSSWLSQSKVEGQDTAIETENETDSRTETRRPFLILNLASALRFTVIKMMDRSNLETTAPLHWAGYVLHGAWFCGFPIG